MRSRKPWRGGIETIKDKVEDARAKPAPDDLLRVTHGSQPRLTNCEQGQSKKELVANCLWWNTEGLWRESGQEGVSLRFRLTVPAFPFPIQFSNSHNFFVVIPGACCRSRVCPRSALQCSKSAMQARLGWREPGVHMPGGGYGLPGPRCRVVPE